MTHYTRYALYIHAGYHDVTLILSCLEQPVIAMSLLAKNRASSLLVQELYHLLATHELKLEDLSWVGAHVGPAPFTTLRTVLATLNGLSWVTPLPLIGVNGLRVWSDLYPDRMIMLNAFCKDVYIGYYDNGTPIQACHSLEHAMRIIQEHTANKVLTLVGNGAQMYRSELLQQLGTSIDIVDEAGLECLPTWCLPAAWQAYDQQEIVRQLEPVYLKASSSGTLSPYKMNS